MDSSLHKNEDQQLEEILINLIEIKKLPNLQEALLYKKKNSVKQKFKNKQFQLIADWQQFGPGVNLYFTLLKYLSILFIILFINAIPSMILNARGKGLEIYHQRNTNHFKIDIMKISLANIADDYFDKNSLINSQNKQLDSQNNHSNQLQNNSKIESNTVFNRFVICLNDVYLTLIILSFFIFWQIKSKQLILQDTKHIDLPSYRTLLVSDCFQQQIGTNIIGLNQQKPDEMKCNTQTQRNLDLSLQIQYHQLSRQQVWENAICRHFNKFGKVDSVTIIYDYGQTLQQLIEFNSKVKQYSNIIEDNNSHKKIQKYMQLKQRFQKIKISYLQRTQNNVKKYNMPFLPKKALVTFHSKEDRNRVKNLYKYKINAQQLYFSLFSNTKNCQNKIIPQNNLPKVKKCSVEPISVTWQNFHRRKREQIVSTMCIGSILSLALLLALIAIFILSIKMAGLVDQLSHTQNDIQPLHFVKQIVQQHQKSIFEKIIDHPTYFEALNSKNIKTLYNFCSSLQLSYSNFKLQYYILCEDYFTNFTQKSFTMIVLSAMILIINLILNYIIYALVDFRRHRTKTQKNRFLIVNIFLVYFVNMVLIVLLIRADFDSQNQSSSSLVEIVKKIFPQFESQRKIQTYEEFNRKWFIHIGNQLLLNYVLALIISPWLYVLVYWIIQKSKLVLVKFKKFSRTQSQLNQTLLSEQFDFQTFYAMILNSFFFCMVFGTGIPLFYFLGALSFLSLYLGSSVIFYNFCKVPQPFDHSINSFISKILLFGLAVHQIMVIFFVFVQDIFPQIERQRSIKEKKLFNKLKSGWFFIVLFILVLIFYLFKKQICKIIQKKYFPSLSRRQLNQQQIMKQHHQSISRSHRSKNIGHSQQIDQQEPQQIGNHQNHKDKKKRNNDLFKTNNSLNGKQIVQENFNEQKKYQQSNLEGIQTLQSALKDQIEIQKEFLTTSRKSQTKPDRLKQKSRRKQIQYQPLEYYYRMQDNPLYTNVYYILTVFHKIVYNTSYQPSSSQKICGQQQRSKVLK